MPETIAAYWESTIRIYGFNHRPGLVFLTVDLPMKRLEYWGGRFEKMVEQGGGFTLAFFQNLNHEIAQFCVVLEKMQDQPLIDRFADAVKNNGELSLTLDFPVDMISFHGPHFQDRYGIAEVAFAALEKAGVPILAAGCAGTSVCLVVSQSGSGKALELLGQAFVVPCG